MSDAYIVRRGGGGEGFDPNGAVLKVVTSTGCTVAVTNSSAGYSKTHQQVDGYPRSGDANVTEHFFSIPASAFGTFTVVATNTYGDNTKTLTVNTAGKVYELLCGGINILLNPSLGAQEGLNFRMLYGTKRYDADYKCYFFIHDVSGELSFVTQPYDLGLYDNIVLKGVFAGYGGPTAHRFDIALTDKDNATRYTTYYRPYTSGNNMQISIPVEDKSKSPYTLECQGEGYDDASFRLNELYFE